MEFAVGFSKVPIPVCSVDKVDQSVERGHRHVRKGQVEQKVVGHRPHTLVSKNDPNDNKVPEHRHRQHGAVGDRPESDAPRRLHELVGVVGRHVGSVMWSSHPFFLYLESRQCFCCFTGWIYRLTAGVGEDVRTGAIARKLNGTKNKETNENSHHSLPHALPASGHLSKDQTKRGESVHGATATELLLHVGVNAQPPPAAAATGGMMQEQ